jgi:hypothetical protein
MTTKPSCGCLQPGRRRPSARSAPSLGRPARTLGSALGIYLSGAAIDAGLGLASVNWIGGLITTAGLVVGVSGKLGQYMAHHALGRGYEVVGVCRAGSVDKLGPLHDRITVGPGPTNDREVTKSAAQSSSSAASSARDETPSLVNTLRRWKSTVRGDTNSWAAASRLLNP